LLHEKKAKSEGGCIKKEENARVLFAGKIWFAFIIADFSMASSIYL
jgi:hypothetical protein